MPKPKSGRPLAADLRPARGVRMTDDDWQQILTLASLLDLTTTDVVLQGQALLLEHLRATRPGVIEELERREKVRPTL